MLYRVYERERTELLIWMGDDPLGYIEDERRGIVWQGKNHNHNPHFRTLAGLELQLTRFGKRLYSSSRYLAGLTLFRDDRALGLSSSSLSPL